MSPNICHRDIVFAASEPQWWPKKTGSIYLFHHPRFGWIIKKLQTHASNKGMTFVGENSLSVSPKAIGLISDKTLLFRVLSVFRCQ
ncbi:hypothetical protein SAMN02745132_01959 [Enterovibrio nigricans DSM 22720]|uniref:Peptidase S24-like n=2 Tax=Enterovibrio nigricans TaxID=504469 RepID=A0A1T4UL24_9GAMM|nr:hypothetical protein SAMN02745132_01959 [Enterovibrio nigricans DSM 22720]